MIILLTVLAVARVTRFITSDVLFDTPRNAVVKWLIANGEGNERSVHFGRLRTRAAYLIVCDWCSSIYVGAAAAGAWYAWGETMAFMAITLALAASYVTGFVSTITERGE